MLKKSTHRLGILLVGLGVMVVCLYGIVKKCTWHPTQKVVKQNAQASVGALKHLACIMDGNRRWAKQNGLVPWYGHRQGIEALKLAVQFCVEKQIPYLSLYTFSLENFKRSEQENSFLFDLILQEAEGSLKEFKNNNVRLRFIGDRSYFPARVAYVLEALEAETAQATGLTINLLFCYGGRQEIVAGVKRIVNDAKANHLKVDDIDEQLIKEYLWLGDCPDPDLIIRTGGYKRLSNFLLYQSAYTELYFLDCLWPELTRDELEDAVVYYEQCQKNFGK